MNFQTNQDARIPTASFLDRVRFLTSHLLPSYLEGMFLRNEFWVRWFGAVSPTPGAASLYRRMSSHYRAPLLYITMPGGRRIVIVNDDSAMDRALAYSPDVYGPPRAKVRGMSMFQPGAVTISTGQDWQRRRALNEQLLQDAARGEHRNDVRQIVRELTSEAVSRSNQVVDWSTISKAFGRIARVVIFGRDAQGDTQLTDDLRSLMRRANWLFLPPRNKKLRSLIDRIRQYAEGGDGDSIVGRFDQSQGMTMTDMCQQAPHWMFAMTDTLAEAATRALVLIASESELVEQVRTENESARMQTLDAAIAESLRLFPPTTTLGRQTTKAEVVANEMIPAGTQVLVLSLGWHRDADRFPDPHRFIPSRYNSDQSPSSLFFGGGSQRCAGRELAMLICREFIGCCLENSEVAVLSPSLNIGADLPYRLNPFASRLQMTPRSG